MIQDMFDSPVMRNLDHRRITHNKFWSSDQEELFNHSVKRLGPTWKYAKEEVHYVHNTLGKRSPELSTIIDNNFFIAYGCSHTEGIGIAEEDRYSNVLAKRLGMKFLNFGQGSASQNFMWMNNTLGSKNLKFKPKFVICQWPEITRIGIIHHRTFEFVYAHTLQYVNNTDVRELWQKIVMVPKFYQAQALGYFHSINQMWSNVGTQVIHFTLDQETADLLKIKKFYYDLSDPYSLARDVWHPGATHNLEFADYIESELKNVGM